MIGRELQSTLTKLATQHRVTFSGIDPLPLAPPVSGPQILTGYASTADVDGQRTSFRKGALSWPADLDKLPLVIKHDLKRVAGRVLDLRYDDQGRLRIQALVTDPEAARMGGFSIAATVTHSTMHHADSAHFRATVEKAVLDEISLTPIPSNKHALVLARSAPASFDHFLDSLKTYAATRSKTFDLYADFFRKSAEIVEQLAMLRDLRRELRGADSRSEVQNAAPCHIYGNIPRRPARKTEFKNLVDQLGAPS